MTRSSNQIREGCIVVGSLFNEPMRVETARIGTDGTWAVGLVGTQSERFRKVTLTARDIDNLTILDSGFSYDGDSRLLRLGLQAYSLGIAYEYDPHFGLSISRVDPLPHQLEAVYDNLLCYFSLKSDPLFSLKIDPPSGDLESAGNEGAAEVAQWLRPKNRDRVLCDGRGATCPELRSRSQTNT